MKVKELRNKSYSKVKEKKWKITTLQKKAGQNRESLDQPYYCGSGWLMDYPLEKLFGCNVSMVLEKGILYFGKKTTEIP